MLAPESRPSCRRPVSNLNHAVDRIGDARRVRDHDDGAAELVAQSLQRPQNDLLVAPVELRGRLVCEYERRLPRGRGRDRESLLLAAGQRAGTLSGAALQVEGLERSLPAARPPRWPASRSPSATFSRALKPGQRFLLWKMIATSRAR